MSRLPRIWVFFLLALSLQAVGPVRFEPVMSRMELPQGVKGRTVWLLDRIGDGRLVVGVEGALAIGGAGASWRIEAVPGGLVPRAISEEHGMIAVAGHGFVALLGAERMRIVPEVTGHFFSLEAVPEGWLAAGGGGVVLLRPDGTTRRLREPNPVMTSVVRIGSEVVVSGVGFPPQRWAAGALESADAFASLDGRLLQWPEDGWVVTEQGIRELSGLPALEPELDRALLASGINGLRRCGPWMLVSTVRAGIVVLDRDGRREVTRFNPPGNVFTLARIDSVLLAGTTEGVTAMADPWRHAEARLPAAFYNGLEGGSDGAVRISTSEGLLTIDRGGALTGQELGTFWPGRGEVEIRERRLHFRGHSAGIFSRVVFGVAVASDVAAVASETRLVLLDASGESRDVQLPVLPTGLASDGRQFLVSTSEAGVLRVDPSGTILGTSGSGRTLVREVAPGEVVVLQWDGLVMDGAFRPLGRVDWGHPLDAARVADELVVLASRPDREAVAGILSAGGWEPLEIPGMQEVQPVRMAATPDSLWFAGDGRVLRARLPLARSPLPEVRWLWQGGTLMGDPLRIDAGERSSVGLEAVQSLLRPFAAARIWIGEGGAWRELRPESVEPVPLERGENGFLLRIERNGRVLEQNATVVRHWPWWLRGWMWPVHAGLAVLVVTGIVRWRTRFLRRRNEELEAKVAERTEQLVKASAVKEEFLTSISHEIRNPLNGVVGICAMLGDSGVGARERHLVRTLSGCADQLRSMLDDILDFSRIERGEDTLTLGDFEVVSLVEEVARTVDPDLASCSLRLPDTPCWLRGDSGKVRQILCNLVSNALKYGMPPAAEIELRLSTAGQARRMRLSVRNAGPVIPPEELERIFEPFHRGTRAAGVPGTGLGLAVSRRLARCMGGTLEASSDPERTEFVLNLELEAGCEAQPAARAEAPVSRALAVEDEGYNRIALGHVLSGLGYSVDWAVDGPSAIELAAKNRYDLVLTDWRLPGTDGAALCRDLANVLPRPAPPIIAVTAYSTREKIEQARAAGMAGFITKPVTRDKLERVLRSLHAGVTPRGAMDVRPPGPADPPAPDPETLDASLRESLERVRTQGRLRDPRTAESAHRLLGLLRFTADENAVEQVELLESAARSGDWAACDRLDEFVVEAVEAARRRLRG